MTEHTRVADFDQDLANQIMDRSQWIVNVLRRNGVPADATTINSLMSMAVALFTAQCKLDDRTACETIAKALLSRDNSVEFDLAKYREQHPEHTEQPEPTP